MSTKRFRLTKASKILIMVLVIALIGGGVFAGLKTGLVKTKNSTTTNNAGNNVSSTTYTSSNKKDDTNKTDSDGTINLSLDEWILHIFIHYFYIVSASDFTICNKLVCRNWHTN